MNVLQVLGIQGHRELHWDPDEVETGNPEALDVIAEAERIVEEALARGNPVFIVESPDRPAKRVDQFDQTAKRTVVVPRIAGG